MFKIFCSLLLSCLIYFYWVLPIRAANYYVSPEGNDTNPGSISSPWATVQKAANSLIAGDTVYFRSGTYRPGSTISVKNSGNITNGYITFTGYSNETAIIDGSAISGDLFVIQGKSYIIIKNLTFQNAGHIGILGEGVDHVTIQSNRIDRTGSCAIAVNAPITNLSQKPHDFIIDGNVITHGVTGTDSENISISSGYNFEIRNNDISLNGSNGFGQKEGIDLKNGCNNASVHHNWIHDFNDVSIYIDAYDGNQHNIQIYANRIKCNDTATFGGHGIALSAEQPNGILDGITVYNNIVSNCTGGSGIAVTGWVTSNPPDGQKKNILIANNTLVSNGGAEPTDAGISVYSGANITGPIVIENNILSGNRTPIIFGNSNQVTSSHNLITSGSCIGCVVGNPGFLGINDYHLSSSSTAINSGMNIVPISNNTVSVTTDYDGINRPQGSAYDIGAYEYLGGSTLTPTLKPSNTLSPSPTPKLGDTNNDGNVNGTDYSTWATNYTKSLNGRTNGDFNTDGAINGIDYTIWLNNYGK